MAFRLKSMFWVLEAWLLPCWTRFLPPRFPSVPPCEPHNIHPSNTRPLLFQFPPRPPSIALFQELMVKNNDLEKWFLSYLTSGAVYQFHIWWTCTARSIRRIQTEMTAVLRTSASICNISKSFALLQKSHASEKYFMEPREMVLLLFHR